MTKLQFLFSGYLPYFSFKKWKWGWLSSYGCFITTSVWGDIKEKSYLLISYDNNVISLPTTTSIAKLKKQEELLIKFSTTNKVKNNDKK